MRMNSALAAAVLIAVGCIAATPATAKGECFNKAAQGTNFDEEGAKFQAYEAILQSFDWGAWASWMANKTTPGYKVTTTGTTCKKGGIGIECLTRARICKV